MEVVYRSNYRLAAEPFNVAKCYIEKDIQIVARLHLFDRPADYNLAICSVPVRPKDRPGTGQLEGVYLDVIDGPAECNKSSVLVSVGEVLESPKLVIPSFAGLEKTDDSHNPRMDARGDFSQ